MYCFYWLVSNSKHCYYLLVKGPCSVRSDALVPSSLLFLFIYCFYKLLVPNSEPLVASMNPIHMNPMNMTLKYTTIPYCLSKIEGSFN